MLIDKCMFFMLITSLRAQNQKLRCESHWGQLPERLSPLCQFNGNSNGWIDDQLALGSASYSSAARGVQAEGNLFRLRRFAAKVSRGDSITVGVAGGSFSTGESDEERKGGCAQSTCV
jgi:hypothetical protein